MFNRCLTVSLAVLLLWGPASVSANGLAAIEPQDLRCEALIDPQGIDVVKPRLNWALGAANGSGRGLMQSAYQILVASSQEQLASGHSDVWDSGKVSSDQSINIHYDGTALQSLQSCFWKVMVWDQTGQPSAWSSPARWSMGLLRQEDWKGQWIGRTQSEAADHFAGKWIWYPEGQPE